MRNNKGFTLAELLAIIALIAVFALIAGPNLTEQIKSSEKEEQDILSQNIKNASMIYAGKYYADKLVNGDYDDVEFTLNNLIKDGLLDLEDDECADELDDKIKLDLDGNYNFDALNCYSE